MGLKPLHIAICGAGPAGLSAAVFLHRLGHRISIFDQFETPQPVGSGLILQPAGLAVLDALGLGVRMRALGQRIDRLFGKACGSGRTVLDVRYQALGDARGYAVHRAGLFNVLSGGLAAEGLAVTGSSRITGIDGRVLLMGARREGPFDVIIDALGARSPLIASAAGPDYRRRLSYGAIWASLPWPHAPFDAHALEQRYERASVMIGVLPIGRTAESAPPRAAFFWSLRTADFAAWREAGLAAWKQRVLSLWPETASLLAAITAPEQMTLAAYEHHTLSQPFGNGIIFIGDSAHATSPQLGQGANMALLDAAALAQAFRNSASVQDAALHYARQRRFHVRLYQAMSRLFTPFYQSDSVLLPLARDTLVSVASKPRFMRRLLAGLVSGKLGLR
jgi:salicylate hydroxylase